MLQSGRFPRPWRIAVGCAVIEVALAFAWAAGWEAMDEGAAISLAFVVTSGAAAVCAGLASGVVRAPVALLGVIAVVVVALLPFTPRSCPLRMSSTGPTGSPEPALPNTSLKNRHLVPGVASSPAATLVVGALLGEDETSCQMDDEPTKGTTIGWSVIVMLPALALSVLAGSIGDIARAGVAWRRRRARHAAAQSGSP